MDWLLLGGWLIRLGMIPLVAYRRRLTSALSWLALIFLVPWLGAPLYLLLAEHRTTPRRRRHERIRNEVRSDRHLAFQRDHLVDPLLHGENLSLSRLTRRLGGLELLGGNDVEVLEGDDTVVDRLVQDIDGATDRLHLLFYTIEDDRTGCRVCEAVQRAAHRGVRCRVLADAVGSWRFHRRLANELRAAGVDVRKMLPFAFLLRRLRPLDLRNHRKLAIVDDRVAYSGSMNLVDYDASSGAEYLPWHDVMVRLQGPAVQQLQLIFHEDWQYNTGTALGEELSGGPVRVAGDDPVQVVPSGPTSPLDTIHSLIVAALNAAEERIIITSPYFIPDDPTRVALRLAALRDVRIDIVVPSLSDSRFVTAAGHSYYDGLLADGVRFHRHRSGFLHAKTITVDHDLAMIGSANFDRRSFYQNFELNLLLYGRHAVDGVLALQERYIAASRPLDPGRWRERPVLHRIGEDVARLLSPLL